jgi:hypothetical protein
MDFVPWGFKRTDCKKITYKSSPCKDCDVELIVAFGIDEKTGKPNVYHAVGRDPRHLPSGWRTRLGECPPERGGVDDLTGSGYFVDNITDWEAHFRWYLPKYKKIEYRCFCGRSDFINVDPKTKWLAPPNRDP